MFRPLSTGAGLALLLAVLAPAGFAEVTTLSGLALVQVEELRFGSPGDSSVVSDTFPGTSGELPLQVAASLVSSDPNLPAAAAAAAQFADPRTLAQPNPEEFAINLALASRSEHVRYTAHATAQETRGVRFAPGELSPGSQAGDQVELMGRLFLDGALAVFAPHAEADLRDASVRLHVSIVKRTVGEDDETLFDGEIELVGLPNGMARVGARGDFPVAQLVQTDLAAASDEFAAFSVLILPQLDLDYPYTATVGQPFELIARLEVEAESPAGDAGVAAVIGTPVDALGTVIGLTRDKATAEKFLAALERERANPTGEPAFPRAQAPLLGLCGLFGFESLLGLLALVGLGSGLRGARRRPAA